MLSVLRQNANNWFMVLIFAAITIVFVFTFGSWGGGNVSGQMPVAAIVNGQVISQAQFHAVYANTFRNMQFYRPGYGPEQAKQEDLKGTVLDRLVHQELLAQEAERRGIVIGDDEIVKTIRTRFFKDGKIDREEYKRIVNGVYQTTEARFEDELRRELMAKRIETVLTDSQQVSPAELKEAFDARSNRVNLETVRIDPAFFATTKELDDKVINEWATANNAEIEKFYNEHMNRYRKPKQVRARHVLAKVDESAPDADKKKAKAKAESALKRIKGGEDFATVAKELSDDSTAAAGGDLGFFGPGMMVGPFEEKAFALKSGEVSDVVETKFGYHVIKVEEVQEAVVTELDKARPEIAKQLMQDGRQMELANKAAQKVLADLKAGVAVADLVIEGFNGKLTEKSDNLAAPRAEETGFFNQSARFVPRVGISDDVAKVAFTLTPEKPVADVTYEVSGRIYALKLKARETPDAAKFESEKEAILSSLLSLRKGRIVDDFVKEMTNEAKVEKNGTVLSYGDI